MVLEACQMLYTAWHASGVEWSDENPPPLCVSTGERGYRSLSNPNHPNLKEVLFNYLRKTYPDWLT